jgi:perosamine synthetase
MFQKKNSFGDHTVLTYDTAKFQFLEYFQSLYNTNDLETIHHLNIDQYTKEGIHDIETELHQKFYNHIKTDNTFQDLYCRFIKEIYRELFPEESVILYQSFPSIRIQFPNNVAVPPHYDSDEIGCHPIGEKNFLLPITEMMGTKRLFLESSPGKADYQGITLDYGDLFYFNGNRCTHYNEKNLEGTIRISLDFRTILLQDYMKYIRSGQITTTNPRDPEKKRVPTKMIVGGYYQMCFRDDSLETMKMWHTQKEFLLQSQPNFNEKEAEACYEYLKGGKNFITEFKKTEELEAMIANYIHVKYCIMTTSGNMAIVLALMALNIGQGDDILVPNYTMIATINSIKMVGANPILVDIDKDTLTISKEIIEQALTPNTKGIMHVSLNNRHKNIQEIQEFCKNRNLLLIEDAAQSLGCFVGGQHFGTFGEIGCFSLSTPKIISTGQGGFLVTNNDALAQKVRMIKNFGRKSGGIDVFETFGINMKYTDIQAVIGIEQMKKLEGRVVRMREIYNLYYTHLHHFCKMIPPTEDSWIPWFVDIFIEDRDGLMEFLKIHNIQTRTTYPEINKTPMYYSEIDFPISKWISAQGLFLPSHTLLLDSEIVHICNLIQLYFTK